MWPPQEYSKYLLQVCPILVPELTMHACSLTSPEAPESDSGLHKGTHARISYTNVVGERSLAAERAQAGDSR